MMVGIFIITDTYTSSPRENFARIISWRIRQCLRDLKIFFSKSLGETSDGAV